MKHIQVKGSGHLGRFRPSPFSSGPARLPPQPAGPPLPAAPDLTASSCPLEA